MYDLDLGLEKPLKTVHFELHVEPDYLSVHTKPVLYLTVNIRSGYVQLTDIKCLSTIALVFKTRSLSMIHPLTE